MCCLQTIPTISLFARRPFSQFPLLLEQVQGTLVPMGELSSMHQEEQIIKVSFLFAPRCVGDPEIRTSDSSWVTDAHDMTRTLYPWIKDALDQPFLSFIGLVVPFQKEVPPPPPGSLSYCLS